VGAGAGTGDRAKIVWCEFAARVFA
jgi:hypothetical protein